VAERVFFPTQLNRLGPEIFFVYGTAEAMPFQNKIVPYFEMRLPGLNLRIPGQWTIRDMC